MNEKSPVAMEQHECLVCTKVYDTGAILIHKRMRNISDKNAITGQGLCPEHQKLFDAGYVALVGADPTKSATGTHIHAHEAYRTGEIAHIKKEVAYQIFSVPPGAFEIPMMFVEPAVLEAIKQEEQKLAKDS